MSHVKHMPSLPNYFENPDLLNNTLKAYQDRISGKLSGDKLIKHNKGVRQVIDGL